MLKLCFFCAIANTSFGQSIELQFYNSESQEALFPKPSKLTSKEAFHPKLRQLLDSLHQVGYIQAFEKERILTKDSNIKSYIYIGVKINTVQVHYPNNKTKFLKFKDLISLLQSQEASKNSLIGYSQLHNMSIKADTLYTKLQLKYEEERHIDKIISRGYEDFPTKFLKYKYKLKVGDVLELDKLEKVQAAINKSDIAQNTKAAEVLFEKDKTSLYLYLEKKRANYFDAALGFNTDEKNKLQFQGHIDVKLFNNLNKGEKLHIKYLANSQSQKELQTYIETPLFANSPISPSFEFNLYKKDSSYTNASSKVKLHYELPKYRVFIGYESINSSLNENGSNLNLMNFDSKLSVLGFEYEALAENELQALQEALYIEYGKGHKKDTSRHRLDRLKIHIIKNFSLGKGQNLYLSGQYKKLFSKNYIENEVFRIGGINDLRGVEENSLISSAFFGIQPEYRFSINPNTYIHSISDYASIRDLHQNKQHNIWSFGLGMALLNKLGVFQFSLANPVYSGGKSSFDNTRLHIELKTKF